MSYDTPMCLFCGMPIDLRENNLPHYHDRCIECLKMEQVATMGMRPNRKQRRAIECKNAKRK